MKHMIMALLLVAALAAIPATPAAACESCISDSNPTKPMENPTVGCIDSPGAGGEICTSGGGHCNMEGRCQTPETLADGSAGLSSPGEYEFYARFTAQRSSTDGVGKDVQIRRECDQAVISRQYAAESAQRIRRQSASLSI
ncbi:MAG TPA: hypothetical protein VE913_13580 [Longimicrobium sp.]|nr:hypothetical protein [Longimicrobium sp.]